MQFDMMTAKAPHEHANATTSPPLTNQDTHLKLRPCLPRSVGAFITPIRLELREALSIKHPICLHCIWLAAPVSDGPLEVFPADACQHVKE